MIISMAIATIGFAFGQEDRPQRGTGTGTDVQTGTQTDQQQKKVKKEDLPRSINDAFSTGEYQEWAMEDAYSVTTTPDGREKAAYMVTAKKEEKVNLYFDANGKLIKKEKVDKNMMDRRKGQEDIN